MILVAVRTEWRKSLLEADDTLMSKRERDGPPPETSSQDKNLSVSGPRITNRASAQLMARPETRARKPTTWEILWT